MVILNAIGNTPLVELKHVVPRECARMLAAIRVAKQRGPGHNVATLACDSGLKYLSTDLYKHGE